MLAYFCNIRTMTSTQNDSRKIRFL